MTELSGRSAFAEAFYDYLQALPQKKNKKSVLARIDVSNPPTAESVQESISQIESKHAQKKSVKAMKKVVGPVVAVLKDYYGVIDTLSQADPTPGMVIWGALKIVIDGLGRFIDLFDLIRDEVSAVTTQLRRLTMYEDLYGRSVDMQQLLFKSYQNVFRFWCRVDKECSRSSLNALLRASTSFSTKKLQGITNSLQDNADEIAKLALIIEGQYAGQMRHEAQEERDENKKERDEGSLWRKQLQSDRVRSWLGSDMVNESNLRRHENNLSISKASSACDWLTSDFKFQQWVDEPSASPVLWLSAGPGSGKSVLCSYAAEYLQKRKESEVVAIHFYEFDNLRPALNVLQILAIQLFEQYWLLHRDVPEDLMTASQKSKANPSSVIDFIRVLVKKFPSVYLFLDGLDEECGPNRWNEAVKILGFVISLAKSDAARVRIWYSSQDTVNVRKCLQAFPTLDARDKIKIAIDEYISSTVPGINNPDVDYDTREWILSSLKSRAKGSFLWANLMIKNIEDGVNSFDDLECFIEEGLPQDVDDYYRRMFARYETKERALASKIFAIVTFAKRRLRLSELREAVGMISSQDTKSLKARSIPWRQPVEKLCAPLIELHQDPEDSEDRFCYLFHSTVKDFLISNPQTFQQERPNCDIHLISEATIANACLSYLRQEKYAKILIKPGQRWITSSGEDIMNHRLLTYSAKYWDKHLDEVEDHPEHRHEVEDFLKSTNFQTTLQVQSLVVESQFSLYTLVGCSENHKYLKRVFPRWLSSHNPAANFPKHYRAFISEWSKFLHCATCDNKSCNSAHYQGEIDRCLWSALGPDNFLSRNQERYASFMLVESPGTRYNGETPYYDAVAADGSEAIVLQFSNAWSLDPNNANYDLESWILKGADKPCLIKKAFISNSAIELADLKSTFETNKQLSGQKVVSVTADLSYLRIGSYIFSSNSNNIYSKIEGLDVVSERPSTCFEDIASRGPYLVLTSRRKMSPSIKPRGRTGNRDTQLISIDDTSSSHLGQDLKTSVCKYCSREPSTDEHSSDRRQKSQALDQEDEFSEQSSSASLSGESVAWNSAEESWSDASTETEPDSKVPWTMSDSSEDDGRENSDLGTDNEDESEQSEDDTSSNAAIHNYRRLDEDSDSDGRGIGFNCGSDDEDAYMGDSDFSDIDDSSDGLEMTSDQEDEWTRRKISVGWKPHRRVTTDIGLLTLYDLKSGIPTELFRFIYPLSVMLYESPPVIHPTKTLVVWPLCRGEVLFADFEGKTYFIRKARPSTHNTRHISMQCHFSPCGKFLHVVSLEGQQERLTRAKRKAGNEPSLLVSAFISTHRLSERKTARSPPRLIHRAKVSLGCTDSLCPTRMPVKVTWATTKVYLASSSETNELALFCIDLFRSSEPEVGEPSAISVPRQTVLLPQSARSRTVQYFPPVSPHAKGLVYIGSWASGSRGRGASKGDAAAEVDTVQGLPESVSPPIGFYVDENVDLGGWGPTNAVADLNAETDRGQLKQRMEKFAHEDDCDIEHYFFTRD